MNIKSYLIRLFLYNTILFAQISGIVTELNTGRPIENVNITGTGPGFDKESQYNTIIDDSGQIWFYREVTGIISIRLPIEVNASIRTITDEKESLITVGDGEAVSIIITQTN